MDRILLVYLVSTAILLVSGLLIFLFPPHTINPVIGVRLKRAMKSQEAWDYANKAFGKYLLISAVIYFIVLGGVYLLPLCVKERTQEYIYAIIFLLALMVCMLKVNDDLKKDKHKKHNK